VRVYFVLQLCVLAASHGAGAIILVGLMRSEAALARREPENSLLDAKKFHAHISIYLIALFICSGNLQILSVLPWKERSFDGLPSARHLKYSSLSLVVGDIPQLCLQATYIYSRQGSSNYDIVVPIISLACSAFAVLFKGLKKWLFFCFAPVVQSHGSFNSERLLPVTPDPS
jgi:hypothetical protein